MTDVRAEQRGYLDKAEESLEGAGILLERGLAGLSGSRAYYGTFYVATAYVLGVGVSGSSHKRTVTAFGEHFAKTGRVDIHYHRWSIDAQDDRIEAAYRIAPRFTREDAEERIRQGMDFLSAARSELLDVCYEASSRRLERRAFGRAPVIVSSDRFGSERC